MPGNQNLIVPQARACRGTRKLLDKLRRFATDSRGTATVSYGVVLAIAVGSALSGAALLGPSFQRMFSLASAGSDAGTSRAVVALVVITATAVTVAVGWLILKDPRKKPAAPKPKPRRTAVVEEVLLTRLNAKREVLWQQLIDDHDLLLKNQIEVRHVMTQQPVVISKATSGKEIAQLIRKQGVGHLLVCDDDQNLLGVVRADDHKMNPKARAAEILKPPQSSIAPRATLGTAISILIDKGVSFLPVVDHGILRGVLTPTDLVLTLHCSLQLWYRVAQTMESSTRRAEVLEQTSQSMTETAAMLRQRVQRLPEEVKSVIQTGKADGLVAEINQMTTAVSQLMQQLDEAQTQIRAQTEQIADLKEPTPDETTGAVSREHFDRIIKKLLAEHRKSRKPLSVVLFVAENYQQLIQNDDEVTADDQLRQLAECTARTVSPRAHLARYSDDTLAIILPGSTSTEARELCTQLTGAISPVLGDMPYSNSHMSIVSARQGESAEELMFRAGKRLASDSRVEIGV